MFRWRVKLLADSIADQFYPCKSDKALDRAIAKSGTSYMIRQVVEAVALQCPGAAADWSDFRLEQSPFPPDDILRKFASINIGGNFTEVIRPISPVAVTSAHRDFPTKVLSVQGFVSFVCGVAPGEFYCERQCTIRKVNQSPANSRLEAFKTEDAKGWGAVETNPGKFRPSDKGHSAAKKIAPILLGAGESAPFLDR